MTQRPVMHQSNGLGEVKYLSFVSLNRLVDATRSGRYLLHNFTTGTRTILPFHPLLLSLLNRGIIRQILSY